MCVCMSVCLGMTMHVVCLRVYVCMHVYGVCVCDVIVIRVLYTQRIHMLYASDK